MNKLAKRNKINVMGTFLLYVSICFMALFIVLTLLLLIFNQEVIIGLIAIGIIFITSIPILVKNVKELYKILKLLNSKPEYYLEIYGDNIKVNALDGEHIINFKDIKRLNYGYDRPLISANFF